MTIGMRIKQLRESNGLTQAELGKILGCENKTISAWENGRNDIPMGKVEKISQFFSVKKSWLLGENGEIPSLPRPILDKNLSLLSSYSQLDTEDQNQINNMIKFLLSQDKYKKPIPQILHTSVLNNANIAAETGEVPNANN